MKIFGKKKQETATERTLQPPFIADRRLSYQIANLQGIGSRKQQEDSFAFANATDVTKIFNQGLFAVVADGMGGMSGGQLASETAVTVLRDRFLQMNPNASIPNQICSSMLEATRTVFEALEGKGGSTAIVCVFYNESLYYASVGDSALFLMRGKQLFQLNTEHNVYHEQLRKDVQCGDLSHWDESEIEEARAVTSFLGMAELKAIDYFKRPLPLEAGDVVLLCSDGVCTLSNEDIFECLSEETPQKMCEKMGQDILAADKKHQDNYTALLIKCDY